MLSQHPTANKLRVLCIIADIKKSYNFDDDILLMYAMPCSIDNNIKYYLTSY